MAASKVHVTGPIGIYSSIATGVGLPLAAGGYKNVGHTREGVTITFQKEYDDVQADDAGPDVLRDRIFTGEKVFLDFELHSITRAGLNELIWLDGTVGSKSNIGKRITDLGMDDAGSSLRLRLISETAETGYNFWNVAPIRISQRVGMNHTVAQVRCEAIIEKVEDASALDEFFDNAAEDTGQLTDDAAEVAGGHVVLYNALNELGSTRDGCDIIVEWQYDDVVADVKGPGTTYEKVITGQRVTLNTELHIYDETQLNAALSQSGTYGKLGGVGTAALASFAKDLQLDSVLGINGRDWNFQKVVLDGQQTLTLTTRHSVARLSWSVLPDASGVFFTEEPGEAGYIS